MHINEEEWLDYLSEMSRRQNNQELLETPTVIIDEITELRETEVIQGIKKVASPKSPREDKKLLIH